MKWTRKPSRTSEPGILVVAIGLYMGAFAWAIIRGPDSFLAGLLAGCGSITVGVWMGLVISHHRGYTPVDLITVMEDVTQESDVPE